MVIICIVKQGFARLKNWEIKNSKINEEKVSITLYLTNKEFEHEKWKNDYELNYKITLSNDTLTTEFFVFNKNQEKELKFTCALHSYFNIKDITKVKVKNLENSNYQDQLKNNNVFLEKEDSLIIDKEIDRIYYNDETEKNNEGKSVLINYNENQKIYIQTFGIQIIY
jgi:glucose-6-phosphate 1-epimerase